MPTPTPTSIATFNPSTAVATLGTPDFWTALWVTLLAGAIGGVVYELLALQGNIELPHKPSKDEFAESLPYAVTSNVWDLGIFARIIVGGVAALAALLVLNPTSGFALVATALVAGSAGTSILRSLQDRIAAALAVGEVNKAREDAAKTEEIIDQVQARFDAAQANAGGRAALGAAPGAPTAPGAGSALDDIQSLLGQAKGITRSISRR